MRRLLPILVMLVLLVAAFWWLPLGFAIAFGALILFLIFLEVFLADIRGRHLLIKASREPGEAPLNTYWHGFAIFNWYAIWIGYTASSSEAGSTSRFEVASGSLDGFDSGVDTGGDAGAGMGMDA